MTLPTSTSAWQQLKDEHSKMQESSTTIRSLFDSDPDRFDKYSIATEALVFDYSKNLLTDTARQKLVEMAQQCGVPKAIEAMFTGAEINPTEGRQALHVVLRGHILDGLDAQVNETLQRLEDFVGQVRSGSWLGYTGKPITDVVNIGIGGSHLGPAMVVRALKPFSDNKIASHFVSNVDPAAINQTLAGLDAQTTLFVIASKTFTTLETLQNAQFARRWMLARGCDDNSLARHFVAISSNVKAAEGFGINPKNIFPMWDWVGGRYSLWSAIGLPIALSQGMSGFRELLRGAHHADEHFRVSELQQNIPVMMALLCVWYRNFYHAPSQAILPYSQNLELFPAFLQQLMMESLGKSVDLEGAALKIESGAVIWGAPGTDGQHSFHQLLHQGTQMVPADFIAIASAATPDDATQQAHLLANCFSQSQALMDGKSSDQARQELIESGLSESAAAALSTHKAIPGNRPSNTLLLQELTPFTLGFLTALYEHSVYIQSTLWHINAFDQWGVELGKNLSQGIFEALISDQRTTRFDASTNNLVTLCKASLKS